MKKVGFQLVDWYRKHKRLLPWRKSSSAYHIWISEIMLQQTRVDTVIDYFHRFFDRFPTLSSLASAPQEDVLKMWEGLGYYSRARNIHKTSKILVSDYDAVFPDTEKELLALPGIGPYTAGAILSIAFHKPFAAVDGNVLRVVSRICCVSGDISRGPVRKEITNLTLKMMVEDAPSDFTQALMELGAMVCTPTNPNCSDCPVSECCKAYTEGSVESYPVKAKKKKARQEKRFLAVILHEGKLLVQKRPETGLLSSLWEFPGVHCDNLDSFARQMESEHDIPVSPIQLIGRNKHLFSHIHWDMHWVFCQSSSDSLADLKENQQMVTPDYLDQLSIPTAFRRMVPEIQRYCAGMDSDRKMLRER